MTILILLLFIALTSFLILLKYKKTSIAMLIITLVYFVLVGNGFLALLLTQQLELPYVIDEKLYWEKRNAIVILGAGAVKIPQINIVKPTSLAYARIFTAARLYSFCKKTGNICTIIVSGGDASNTGVSEALAYKKELLDLNVKNSDLILEAHSLNTFQNAKFTSKLIKAATFNKVFLVTSAIHSKRSLLYFSYFGVTATPVASDYMAPIISLIPLGYNFVLADFALHEYAGIVRFQLYNLFGWNKSTPAERSISIRINIGI
ncbi:YdcF family protein [soil metagenome]